MTVANPFGAVSATRSISLSDVPVTGPVAVNDSPTLLGHPTMFTASVGAGSNVSYLWGFGDGGIATVPITTHTYLAAGIYTALVTAANSANQCVASSVVTVSVPRGKLLYVPVVLRPG